MDKPETPIRNAAASRGALESTRPENESEKALEDLFFNRVKELQEFMKGLSLPQTPPGFAIEDLPGHRPYVIQRADRSGRILRIVFNRNRLADLTIEEWNEVWHESFENEWYQEELIRFSTELLDAEPAYYTQESLNQRIHITVRVLDQLGMRDLRGAQIADLGSGSGALSTVLAVRGAHVLAVDGSGTIQKLARIRTAGKVRGAVKRIDYLVEPLSELSTLRDESLDWIFVQSTLYLAPDWLRRRILARAYKKLRPGGQIIILEMSNQIQRSGWDKEPLDQWSGLPVAGAVRRAAINLTGGDSAELMSIIITKPARGPSEAPDQAG
jgi:ubiquinone/menaquinone biosynthesis C-methylase UbiE